LLAAAFIVPILLASLLARGVALERAPILSAVIILGGIGVLLALAVTGFAVLSGRVFIELFLTGALLLAYCVALLHVRHVAIVPLPTEEKVSPKRQARKRR
jgi:hypothetical protein